MKNGYVLKISLICVLIIGLLSCSVEKRLHLKGYNIAWNKNYKTKKFDKNDLILNENNLSSDKVKKYSTLENYENVNTEVASIDNIDNSNNLVASIDNSELIINEQTSNKIVANQVSFVKNKTLNNDNTSQNKVVQEKKSKEYNPEKINKTNFKAKKNITAENDEGSGKSQLVALLLVIFVGTLGIHRFYLGHIGIGILMLLTGGVCGILALIDLIRICTGDLKPKNGDYTKKL